jgi:hypothetical protein
MLLTPTSAQITILPVDKYAGTHVALILHALPYVIYYQIKNNNGDTMIVGILKEIKLGANVVDGHITYERVAQAFDMPTS